MILFVYVLEYMLQVFTDASSNYPFVSDFCIDNSKHIAEPNQKAGSWLLVGGLGAFYPDYKGEGKPKYYDGYIPASFVWG